MVYRYWYALHVTYYGYVPKFVPVPLSKADAGSAIRYIYGYDPEISFRSRLRNPTLVAGSDIARSIYGYDHEIHKCIYIVIIRTCMGVACGLLDHDAC